MPLSNGPRRFADRLRKELHRFSGVSADGGAYSRSAGKDAPRLQWSTSQPIDVHRHYPITWAKELLPPGPGYEPGLGTIQTFRSEVDSVARPRLLCFDNRYQPQFAPELCSEPIVVSRLKLPIIQNARLVGRGIVLLRNDVILYESVGRNSGEKLGLRFLQDDVCEFSDRVKLSLHRSLKNIPARVHECTGLLLCDHTRNNFGTWILKIIPKITAIDVLGDSEVKVVVPSDIPDKYLNLMEGLGILSDQVVLHDPTSVSIFKKLIVPPKVYALQSYSWANPFKVFSRNAGSSPDSVRSWRTPGRVKRVYVSRRSYARRRLVNERAVEELFRSFGFEVVEPGALTAAGTLATFRNCSFVAGPSGSGLYNILFSTRRFKALVLVPPIEKTQRTFLVMSDICAAKGGRVGYVFGRLHDGPPREPGDVFDYSWEVDLVRLRSTLEDLV